MKSKSVVLMIVSLGFGIDRRYRHQPGHGAITTHPENQQSSVVRF